MDCNNFYNAIKQRDLVFGTCITSINPHTLNAVELIGTDFIFIDTEHISLDRKEYSFACRLLNASSQSVILRTTHASDILASVAIDAGAQGVLIPYAEDINLIKLIGATIKYRPFKGDKLQKIITGEYILSPNEKQYIENYNKNKLFFINIESRQGIDNLDEILKTSYVDGVIIGPHDLSVNIGVPEQYDSFEFNSCIKEIIEICVRNNISVGNHFSEGINRQIEWNSYGMNIILNSSDIVSFVKTTQKEIAEMKLKINNIIVENTCNLKI